MATVHQQIAIIITALIQAISSSEAPPNPNPLFLGTTLKDFYEICTLKASDTNPCPLSTPDDFIRLRTAKALIQRQIEYHLSIARTATLCILLVIIFVLMLHLAVVRHFDWRTLPIINLYYDIELDQDKTSGVKFHQYVWMKYLVLRGNHVVFRGQDYQEINWHKYTRDVNFDYKSVRIHKFTFLDKKMLTKHLAEDIEKEADMELHPSGHPPSSSTNVRQ